MEHPNANDNGRGNAPTGFGETLGAIFGAYGKLFAAILPVALGLGIVMEIGNALMYEDMLRLEQGQDPEGGLWLGTALIMLASIYFWAAGLYRGDAALGDGRVDNAFGAAWAKFLPLLGYGIIYFILCFIGLLLLAIPGIIVMVLFAMGMTLIVLRDNGVMQAFGNSARLVWNRSWWFVFGILVVVGIVIGVPAGVVEALITDLRLSEAMGDRLVAHVIGVLLFVVIYPLTISLFWHLLQAVEARKPEALNTSAD